MIVIKQMRDRLATALAGLLSGGAHAQKMFGMPRATPAKRSMKSGFTARRMNEGYAQHLKDVKGDAGLGPNVINVAPPATPQDLQLAQAAPQGWGTSVRGNTPIPGTPLDGSQPNPTVFLNPNADRIYGAKALGGTITDQTQVGNFLADLQGKIGQAYAKNPALAKAALASTFIAPAAYSALAEGDDDTDEALLLASLPTAALPMAKDVMDSYHGQRIMDKSGLQTTLGQRGRLAGSALSYLAIPLLAGSAGNMVGNIFD